MSNLDAFCVRGRTALLTGAGGILGAVFARALAEAGARVWVTDLREQAAREVAARLQSDGLDAHARAADVLDRQALETTAAAVGPIDILVNAAGGNLPDATTSCERSFFDIPLDAIQKAIALNLYGGALLPAQVFGRMLADRPEGGVILNITSMSAIRPLTRIAGYSVAKAAVSNFTQWLAVHMAQEYNPRVRVNAIAPGFFLTDQNRYLLTEAQSGALTPRGQAILDHTPMRRFGQPRDLAGVTLWLCSDASAFVTGIVVPVDGGFSAFSGV